MWTRNEIRQIRYSFSNYSAVAIYHQWIAEMGYVDKSETNEKKL